MQNRGTVAIAADERETSFAAEGAGIGPGGLIASWRDGAFVRPGQTVLIKPNQTVFYSAEEGCTTDPLVVGALIRLAKEAGAGRVQVAESSGGFFPTGVHVDHRHGGRRGRKGRS